MRDGTDPFCVNKLPSNALDRDEHKMNFSDIFSRAFSNIFGIKDYASYSHRQERD
jgi:hypothetical protein